MLVPVDTEVAAAPDVEVPELPPVVALAPLVEDAEPVVAVAVVGLILRRSKSYTSYCVAKSGDPSLCKNTHHRGRHSGLVVRSCNNARTAHHTLRAMCAQVRWFIIYVRDAQLLGARLVI